MILFHGTNISAYESLDENNPLCTPYLTDDLSLAEYYAECAMEDEDDDDYVILAVNITEEELQHLKADFNSFEEPISFIRNNFAESDREWFEKIESGEIPLPSSEHDYQTSLDYVSAVKINIDIPVSRLVEAYDYNEAVQKLNRLEVNQAA